MSSDVGPHGFHHGAMSRPPAPLPPSFPWLVFSRAEARDAGISIGRLRRTDLCRLCEGLYARTSTELTELDIASALCRKVPDAVVVGLSAARLRAVPLPARLETWARDVPVHLAVPGGRKVSGSVMRWHDFVLGPSDTHMTSFVHPRSDPASSDRLVLPARLTSRARTWRDLAAELTHVDLVAVADHLVRRPRPALEGGRRQPWCTLDELRAQCSGRHAAALRRAHADVRIGADSPRETMLRLAFARAGLPEPRINAPLIGAHGQRLHDPDFQWPDYQIAAEYEGRTHSRKDQVARDIARARRVRSAGWSEVRLRAEDTYEECAGAVAEVRKELLAKGWRP